MEKTTSLAHIRLKVPPKELSRLSLGKKLIHFNHHWFIQKEALSGIDLVSLKKFAFSFFFGFHQIFQLQTNDGQKLSTLIKKVIIPNPLFLFTWKRFFFPDQDSDLFVYFPPHQGEETQRPLAFFEYELRALNLINTQRAQFLIQNSLTFIEERNNGKSRLYKDKSDGRLWQALIKEDSTWELFSVNTNQWSFQFIEMREYKKRIKDNPKEHDIETMREYFETLQDDNSSVECEMSDCHRVRAKFSSLCKEHHFEAIMGRSWPL